jgi:hypothetical protein
MAKPNGGSEKATRIACPWLWHAMLWWQWLMSPWF